MFIVIAVLIGFITGYIFTTRKLNRKYHKLKCKYRDLNRKYSDLNGDCLKLIAIAQNYQTEKVDFQRFRQELKAYRELIPLPPNYRSEEFEGIILEGDQA